MNITGYTAFLESKRSERQVSTISKSRNFQQRLY